MFRNILNLEKGLESKSMEYLPLSIFLLEIYLFIYLFIFYLKQIYKIYVVIMLCSCLNNLENLKIN